MVHTSYAPRTSLQIHPRMMSKCVKSPGAKIGSHDTFTCYTRPGNTE